MASVTIPSPASATAETSARRNYSRILEQTWIWSVVGYSLVRFFIAWGAFSEHGANAWVFGLIDVGTAWPYAKAVAAVCKRSAHAEWRQLPAPLFASVTMFFAPYAYLWFAAGEMPAGVRVGMIICVSVLFVAATTGVLAKTRKLRQADHSTVVIAALDGDESGQVIDLRDPAPQADLVIDLTGETATVGRS